MDLFIITIITTYDYILCCFVQAALEAAKLRTRAVAQRSRPNNPPTVNVFSADPHVLNGEDKSARPKTSTGGAVSFAKSGSRVQGGWGNSQTAYAGRGAGVKWGGGAPTPAPVFRVGGTQGAAPRADTPTAVVHQAVHEACPPPREEESNSVLMDADSVFCEGNNNVPKAFSSRGKGRARGGQAGGKRGW
jgi:hypothetical protein